LASKKSFLSSTIVGIGIIDVLGLNGFLLEDG
jgi:hypothetical protein